MSDPRRLAGPKIGRAVLLLWLAGIAVAVADYAVDPGSLLQAALDLAAAAVAGAWRLLLDLSVFGSNVVRALAVGLYVTFVGLALVAIRQGAKGGTALLAVSIAFVLLLRDGGSASNGRWGAALALAAVGALVMTGRVRSRASRPDDHAMF